MGLSEKKKGEVRRVMLEIWDPCCVGSNPNLADEYDEYVDRIIVLASQSKFLSAEKIKKVLKEYEEVDFGGILSEPDVLTNTAERLAELLKDAKEGC